MVQRRNIRALAIPLALVGSLLLPSAALAATDSTAVSGDKGSNSLVAGGTGGDIYTGPPLVMTAFEREHLAEMYATYLAQSGPKVVSVDAVRADAAKQGVSTELQVQVAAKSQSLMAPAAATAALQSYLINVTQQPQTKFYNCGPAAGAEIITTPLFASMKSKKDGSTITQAAMGNASHMNTNTLQVTKWADKKFVTGLNAWTGNTQHVYAQVNAPSATTMIAALTTVMVGGAPVAADTVEFANGSHYNGHPNRLIGHWIMTYYFGNYGATVGFVDSTANSSAVSGFGNAQPKFQVDTASFTTTYLQSNGIAY